MNQRRVGTVAPLCYILRLWLRRGSCFLLRSDEEASCSRRWVFIDVAAQKRRQLCKQIGQGECGVCCHVHPDEMHGTKQCVLMLRLLNRDDKDAGCRWYAP